MNQPSAHAAPWDAPAQVTPQEAGLVGIDGYVHAIRRRMPGRFAWCGAGRITTVVLASFDPRDTRSCPKCAAAVRTA